MVKVIGMLVVLAVAVLFGFLTCKSKGKDLFKWVGIFIFIAFCFSWVFPNGSFSGGEFVESGMNRLGLSDISNIGFYSIYFCASTVLYLLALGGFYGVVSKTKGYQRLVNSCGKVVKSKKMLFSIIISVVLIVLTSFVKSTFAILAIVPFIVSILLNAKFDKIKTMILTFGSVLTGVLAATYGTDGLYWFNSYTGNEISVGLTQRLIFAGIVLLLFIGFIIFKFTRKNKNEKNNEEEANDLFEIPETKTKASMWPTIVIFALLLIIIVIGFIPWESYFEIETFTKFHECLTELRIGEEFTIFSYILGSSSVALGSWEISSLTVVVLILTIITALVDKMKLSEFVENFANGLKKMVKPSIMLILCYTVFVTAYMTQFMVYVSSVLFGITESFNPFITAFVGFISSIFHADLGYTGYLVGDVLTTNYTESINLAHTLFVSTYGLAQIIAPTSGVLLIGLSYLDINYKSWVKYIWMFVVAIVLLIIIFAAFAQYVF